MDITNIAGIFNENTISVDGDIAYSRLYVALYPNVKFIEDARPDYTILRKEFDSILMDLYKTTGISIYKSYFSGKCFDIRVIEDSKVMFFITYVTKEDIVDRNYRFSEKDLALVSELGGIDNLQSKLDKVTPTEYNALSLAPFISDKELEHAILNVFFYPIEDHARADEFCTKYDVLKFDRLKIKPNTDNAIYTLGQNGQGLVLHKHYLNTANYKFEIIESNYNDTFSAAYESIIKFLKSDDNGLILLTGAPGTGKSSLLIHLISVCKELDTKFVFVPAAFAYILSDPSFLPFAAVSLNDSVLILEDAEEILKDRAVGGANAVSNILNITDGILGKIIKVKLIATVNKSHIIDAAIVRKGRLRLRYEFEKLSVDKSNKLFTKLGKNTVTEVPLTLSEIYNKDSNVDEPVTKKKIGF